MKKISKRIWVVLVFILLVISEIIYAYEPFASGNKGPLSLSYYKDVGLFRIDPETIMTSLNQGDTDVFLPDSRTLDEGYTSPILYTEPILWSQSDNLKIVNALNKYVWKDSLDDWKLSAMYFNVDCQNSLNALPGGGFQYFKTIFDHGKVIDVWREFQITPESLWVAWGGGARYPHRIPGLKSIDLNRLKVTAEDAIRIAEEHGGKDVRLKAQNKCSIHLSLWPQGVKWGWWVTYNTSDDFEIRVNPYTGEVIEQLP